MGHFSYICKHCDRPILDSQSTWRGLNEWMATTVVLMASGSRVVGEYDGYGRVGRIDANEQADADEGVWTHKACWEQAGKPEHEAYTGPSVGCQHSGYDEKDLRPEPGKPFDQAAWDAALQERADKIRADLVRKACEMVNDGHYNNADSVRRTEKPWTRRFHVYHFDGQYQIDPKNPEPAGWVWYDESPEMGGYADVPAMRDDPKHGPQIQSGGTCETEAEAEAACKARWDAWMQSDELAQMKRERAATLRKRSLERAKELLIEGEDRYEVTDYGPAPARLEALLDEKEKLTAAIDTLNGAQVARLGEINDEIANTPRWGVYDRADFRGEDGDEDDRYVLTGATEDDAKAHAADLNRIWRGA